MAVDEHGRTIGTNFWPPGCSQDHHIPRWVLFPHRSEFSRPAQQFTRPLLARSTFSGLLGDKYQGEPVPGHAVLFKAEVLAFLWLKMAGYSEKVGYLVVKLLYGSWYFCSWKKAPQTRWVPCLQWWVLDDLRVPNVWENPNLRSVDPITNHSINSINEPWLRVIISIIPVIFQANTTKLSGGPTPATSIYHDIQKNILTI